MNNIIIPAVLLIVGVGVGYMLPGDVASLNGGANVVSHDEETHTHHDIVNIEGNAPTVDLVVHKDPKSGWNAQIVTTNFAFAPENASGEHVDGEGHAHIYVDGVKINRVYGEWYHLGELEEGDREVQVRLSTNDHRELAVRDEVVADTELVSVMTHEEMKDEESVEDEMMHMEGDVQQHEESEDHSHE